MAAAALLVPATPAAGADFPAAPGTLGEVPRGSSGGPSCEFGPPKDVLFDVAGLYGPITDVAVTMQFEPRHGFAGDLSVTLLAPGGAQSATVFHRTGADGPTHAGFAANVAGPYTFTDSAPVSPSWWEVAGSLDVDEPIPPGSYRASAPGGQAGGGEPSLLSPAFAAAPPNGTWTLRFVDRCMADTGPVSAATLSLDTEPPGDFSFGKLKRNKPKGTAKLTVDVPAPGAVELAKSKTLKPARVTATAPGSVRLAIKPKGKAKGKLNDDGSAKLRAEVTYTPTGGSPQTETKKLKLVKK